MKKKLVLLSAAALVALGTASLVSCQGNGTTTYKIAVATIHEGENWEIQKKYFEEEVGPALNMEFMFSEKNSNDAAALMEFMAKAYASNCDGVINLCTSSDAVAQAVTYAEEHDMYFVTQSSAIASTVSDVDINMGHLGASSTGMGSAYKEAYKNTLSDGEDHKIFIFSGAAVGGATGTGASSHYYSVQGILEAIQESYGLTYTKTIDEIINTQDPGEVAISNYNGHDGVKIYIYPGDDTTPVITSLQAQLQANGYDIFTAVFSFSQFLPTITEYETEYKKDVKVFATASIENQTETAFSTLDPLGNSQLNGAILNPLNPANGLNAVQLYNGLTGHGDVMKDNGEAVLFKVQPWVCMSAETYENIGKLDKSHETYVLNGDELQELLVENNSSVTYKDIEAKLEEIGDVNNVIAKKLG